MTNTPKPKTTEKLSRNVDGTLVKGSKLNPTGKGGFQERPEDRASGRWKKEDSISYNYHYYMAMGNVEFDDTTPETMAQTIAYNRIKDAKDSLNDVKEITDRTEGKAQQSIDMTTGGEPMTALVQFMDNDGDNKDTPS